MLSFERHRLTLLLMGTRSWACSLEKSLGWLAAAAADGSSR